MKIKRLLIANRGEIAVRIIRAAREMGIETVAVHSTADREALHVQNAHRSIQIGPPPLPDSYLYYQNILSAARAVKADAIHPGYGFFAENPAFAEACRALGIIFVGPAPEIMEQMGNKSNARNLMRKVGVPVVPGSPGDCGNFEELQKTARNIGYPLIIKASAGGGGRGMRRVQGPEELETAFYAASSEALNAFSDPRVYVERYIQDPKHIEVQVLGDREGRVVHLGERDCSIQRKHQKLVEEAPCPVLKENERETLTRAALRAARAVGYYSAGTVEFLFDQRDRRFYFMEMNTRIQVEHPVTEVLCGVDLVREQIAIAGGEGMGVRQEDIRPRGHALECRINAEDPEKNFQPSPGEITAYREPSGEGIRVDSGVYPGSRIPPFYDSLIAKVIARGENRETSLAAMSGALADFRIRGVATTIPFHLDLLSRRGFVKGDYTTHYLEEGPNHA